MDYAWYLFGFKGRINRARYWQATLIILCWMIFLGMLTIGVVALFGGKGPINLGYGVEDLFKVFDPASYRSLSLADLPAIAFKTAFSALFMWVWLATSIKRLHDRDKSGWWVILFFTVPLYNKFVDLLPDDSYFADVVFPFGLAAFAGCIWIFVELCFLKGSRNTNRFGPDPLAPKARPDTRPPWDQQSEIEMVPHKAGPPPVWRVKPGYE
ncbi:DUF805 domain-containing protein [Bradyrhizobium sp. CB3481]|uniref:DUF805 domain-containing protein n=1 Tax=Bradyrhizobium sp. CB3481 TaxID=3039158 RepID=UPI0024B25F25|nr:DUF805 domain-containing protein [Bradyrhizobium sp. CB3481]WFU16470.1 DUF805 domain-containing protein [Bradyrhizobium sp. CB3481]